MCTCKYAGTYIQMHVCIYVYIQTEVVYTHTATFLVMDVYMNISVDHRYDVYVPVLEEGHGTLSAALAMMRCNKTVYQALVARGRPVNTWLCRGLPTVGIGTQRGPQLTYIALACEVYGRGFLWLARGCIGIKALASQAPSE